MLVKNRSEQLHQEFMEECHVMDFANGYGIGSLE